MCASYSELANGCISSGGAVERSVRALTRRLIRWLRYRRKAVFSVVNFLENWLRVLGAVGGGSKIALFHGLYNSLYYRTSRDVLTYTYQILSNIL